MVDPELVNYRNEIQEIVGRKKFNQLVATIGPVITASADEQSKPVLQWALDNKKRNDTIFGKQSLFILAVAVQITIQIENS